MFLEFWYKLLWLDADEIEEKHIKPDITYLEKRLEKLEEESESTTKRCPYTHIFMWAAKKKYWKKDD